MEVFATLISNTTRRANGTGLFQKYPGESYCYQWNSDGADQKVHHKCKSLIACCSPLVREFMASSK